MYFGVAEISDIDNILQLYDERMNWFKKNNINQWKNYLERHPQEEFIKEIEHGNYFILKKDEKVIAGFKMSTESKYWNDDASESYYIYKLVTKLGQKNIGNIIFKISKNIAKNNKKQYLRLDCVSTNGKLNSIYQNYGFKLIRKGKIGNYNYSLMECDINE